MPTDDEATVIDPTTSSNAADTEQVDVEKLKEELSQAKQRESAARKKMDEATIELKKLKSEAPKKKEGAEEPQYVTKDELWDLAHAKELEVYSDDEYKADIESGIPRDYALKTAKLRHTAPKDAARRDRQESMSSASGSGRDLSGGDDEIILTPEQIKRGITKEMVKKYKDM